MFIFNKINIFSFKLYLILISISQNSHVILIDTYLHRKKWMNITTFCTDPQQCCHGPVLRFAAPWLSRNGQQNKFMHICQQSRWPFVKMIACPCLVHKYHLNQCWLAADWILRNLTEIWTKQGNIHSTKCIYNGVCKMSVISSCPQCVNKIHQNIYVTKKRQVIWQNM